MGYKSDLEVDSSDLVRCWSEQPLLLMKYGEFHANAVLQRDRLKEKIKLKRAELSRDIRRNPGKHGMDKVTEGAIEVEIDLNSEIQGLQDELLEKERAVNVMSTAKVAFEHRRKALEGETSLHLTGYFSEVRLPKRIREEAKPFLVKRMKATMDKNRAAFDEVFGEENSE